MRVITLEEHVIFPEIVKEIKELVGEGNIKSSPAVEKLMPKLQDVNGERLTSMDDNGISLQVLSVAGPGADLLDGEQGIAIAHKYNDALAEKIAVNPERFTAFAHLPMRSPLAAADELERTVKTYNFRGALINGLTNDEFLDDAKYAPLFERTQQLDVPIYLHPGMPPDAVANAYYGGLPKEAGQVLSVAGWGWHSETALHVLRLIVSGTFDRYPKLKLIIGHMGEMLPMMMARCDMMFKPGETGANKRTISQTLKDQVYITTSGIFTLPPLLTALATFGADRVLFSIDYPFAPNEAGKKFIDSLPLSDSDKEKIAFKNAEALLKL